MTADSMVAQAEKSLGVGEPNYMQKWYSSVAYVANWPWCDIAVSYWAAHSGNGPAVGRFAYTVSHANWFKSKGQWHTDVAGIRRGDVVFFDWGFSNSISAIDHVGLVTSVSGSNVFTIEGNTANVCARRVRHANTIAGYGRPMYGSSVAPKPGPPPAHVTYEPFPGRSFFTVGHKSAIIARCHTRLVAEGCNHYETNQNRDTWGTGDRASYAAWQHKLGYTGADADGTPGKISWDKLKVPRP